MSTRTKRRRLKLMLASLATVGVTFITGGSEPRAFAENQPNEFQSEELYLIKGAEKEEPRFSIEARWFAPHLEAKVKSDKIYYNGGAVSLKDDLGFGNDNAPEFILRYKRMTLDYIYVDGSGERNFRGRNVLTFGGWRFHGDVHAKNKLHYLKLNITNPISGSQKNGLDWSYGLTGMYWKGSITGTEVGGRTRHESKQYGIPVPTLGVGAHAALLPNFNAYAHISGLPLGGYGHFYDFETGVRYHPIEHLAISAGFRRIDVNVDHNDDSGKLTMNGPFAGLRYDF